MITIGEALIEQLEAEGVDVVFGIPGIHTIELYRGLAGSQIRHITARHEQGAGFMADGYARVIGKPGVAFVITGPGLTNILTAMAQARADSVPMLVISSANERASLGLGLGDLHELPDQLGLAAKVAEKSTRIETYTDLKPALEYAYQGFAHRRPGPTHIEIPKDVLGMTYTPGQGSDIPISSWPPPGVDPKDITRAADILRKARMPLILAGGGARSAEAELNQLALSLDAPVVQTVNARGLLHQHPLAVPASPSLKSVRQLIRKADAVVAVGTELGATDYDMYADGNLPDLAQLIRVDICPEQLDRHPATLRLCGHADAVLRNLSLALLDGPPPKDSGGRVRAKATRDAALEELSPDMRTQLSMLEAIRDAAPKAIIVGDSTQPIYAGNLYFDHDRPCGWFNAATGFGALGYAIPAAIGASLAAADARVICLIGDGGAQFTLTEMLTAVDENLPVTFIIWNNQGYLEIETSMRSAGVSVVGCDPTPPVFADVARAFGMPYRQCAMRPDALGKLLRHHVAETGPMLIEIDATNDTKGHQADGNGAS